LASERLEARAVSSGYGVDLGYEGSQPVRAEQIAIVSQFLKIAKTKKMEIRTWKTKSGKSKSRLDQSFTFTSIKDPEVLPSSYWY
jgi:hypothetical protein